MGVNGDVEPVWVPMLPVGEPGELAQRLLVPLDREHGIQGWEVETETGVVNWNLLYDEFPDGLEELYGENLDAVNSLISSRRRIGPPMDGPDPDLECAVEYSAAEVAAGAEHMTPGEVSVYNAKYRELTARHGESVRPWAARAAYATARAWHRERYPVDPFRDLDG